MTQYVVLFCYENSDQMECYGPYATFIEAQRSINDAAYASSVQFTSYVLPVHNMTEWYKRYNVTA